jgi:diguanylate cyclase (GGDEF)-like protein
MAYQEGGVKVRTGSQVPSGLGGVVCAPIGGLSVNIGVVSLLWPGRAEPAPDPDRDSFLLTVGHMVGISIEHAGLVTEMVENYDDILQLKDRLEERNQELQKLNKKLEDLSVTDSLTGIPNRRFLMQRLDEEISRAHRLNLPLSLVMADLDHFKGVNDQLGHQAGDEALKRFASWLAGGVRKIDTVGRYGGEEFLVILVNCGRLTGCRVADKLRRLVEENSPEPPFDEIGGFTVSMGVAQLEGEQDAASLIAAADEAMYRAKAAGRNKVLAA